VQVAAVLEIRARRAQEVDVAELHLLDAVDFVFVVYFCGWVHTLAFAVAEDALLVGGSWDGDGRDSAW
jgi:hypothetical protein